MSSLKVIVLLVCSTAIIPIRKYWVQDSFLKKRSRANGGVTTEEDNLL